jgi:hypothetical protein
MMEVQKFGNLKGCVIASTSCISARLDMMEKQLDEISKLFDNGKIRTMMLKMDIIRIREITTKLRADAEK